MRMRMSRLRTLGDGELNGQVDSTIQKASQLPSTGQLNLVAILARVIAD